MHSLCQQIKNNNNQEHIPESLHYMTKVADNLSTPDASASGGATQTPNNNKTSGQWVPNKNGLYIDMDGNKIRSVNHSTLCLISKEHNSKVLPVICELSTGSIYILTKNIENKNSILAPCIWNKDNYEYVFGALYLQLSIVVAPHVTVVPQDLE